MSLRSLFQTVSAAAAEYRLRNPPKRASQFQLALKAADLLLALWIRELPAQGFPGFFIDRSDHIIHIKPPSPDFR
jgi:hypothetical protein